MMRRHVGQFVLSLSVLASGGCRKTLPPEAVGVLPASKAGAALSPYEPARPMVVIADGMTGRTIHHESTGAGYAMEVREFIVGPGPRTVNASLKTAGVLEVTSGSGTMRVGEERHDLQPGSTLAIPDDRPITIENPARASLNIRAYMFVAE